MNLKLKLLYTLLFLIPAYGFAQIKPNSTLFLKYVKVEGKKNMNGQNTINMLQAYLLEETSLIIKENLEDAEYTGEISLTDGAGSNRISQLTIIDNKDNTLIYKSKRVKGNANAFSGYNGTRHSIRKLVRNQLLKKYPSLKL